MTGPLVSVLVTTYNHERYVEQALDSVLAQDFADHELVVTDDASDDGSVAVIGSWLERAGLERRGIAVSFVAHDRNLGICATRNRAIARARGAFVCSLSGDDWYEPHRLRLQSACLSASEPSVAAVYSDVRIVSADAALVAPSYLRRDEMGTPPSGDIFARMHAAPFLPAVGVMVRKAAIEEVGGYDESLSFEDWDMWLRLADRFEFAYCDGVVANWRTLPTSLYHSRFGTPQLQASVAHLNAKWLDRDPVARSVSARWIRDAVPTIAGADRREARRLLRLVAGIPAGDRVPWRLVERMLAVPGSGRLAAPAARARKRLAAAAEAERGAWRSGRRLRR